VVAWAFPEAMTVKTRPFLRDVDDVSLYAELLENCHGLLYEELSEILAKFPILETRGEWINEAFSQPLEVHRVYEDLARMRHTMSMMIREMADRKRRLADRAVGLSDIELYE